MSTIVVGLGFGDEGKGATVDWLCSTQKVDAVVRFNGGCQAAHNVVMEDGRSHTFAQFGSGTLRGVPTYLSEYMMIEPFSLDIEAKALAEKVDFDPYSLLYVSEKCLITTPYHWEVNRAREESRGVFRHGSCGRGIGETARYALDNPFAAPRIEDLFALPLFGRKLEALHFWASRIIEKLGREVDLPSPTDLYSRYRSLRALEIRSAPAAFSNLIFEGAQGVLLDETHGFNPYTTWSTTTPANALALCKKWEIGDPKVLGVTRSYHTRHGAGPFPSEVTWDLGEEKHNGTGLWQGPWRTGWLDLVLLRYAAQLAHLDEIALTHMDYCQNKVVTGYATPSGRQEYVPDTAPATWGEELASFRALLETVSSAAGLILRMEEFVEAPVTSLAHGPTAEDRRHC